MLGVTKESAMRGVGHAASFSGAVVVVLGFSNLSPPS
jgi:hypothetical protein